MLTVTNTLTPSPSQWQAVIRGMRNPMNSWDKSDSDCENLEAGLIGENDMKLMLALGSEGQPNRKFLRMIFVYVDVTAPLYWWKEFDTYKIGTVANSCSTMHKIHAKEFTLDDFSHEHLIVDWVDAHVESFTEVALTENNKALFSPTDILKIGIDALNVNRHAFLTTKNKDFWWQMIQLLPSSYNQKRTVMLNYEVLLQIYQWRKNHKLDEWHTFCNWIRALPYAEQLICIVGEQRRI